MHYVMNSLHTKIPTLPVLEIKYILIATNDEPCTNYDK
jgi:hypothetical protein